MSLGADEGGGGRSKEIAYNYNRGVLHVFSLAIPEVRRVGTSVRMVEYN